MASNHCVTVAGDFTGSLITGDRKTLYYTESYLAGNDRFKHRQHDINASL